MTNVVTIAGAGSFVPPTIITNDALVRFIGEKNSLWIENRLGIKTRRFMSAFDENGTPLHQGDELDLAERAARDAIINAEMEPREVDGLHLISCTANGNRMHLSRMAFELHGRLNLPSKSRLTYGDFGCGGMTHAIGDATDLLRGNSRSSMLIVASNAPSSHFAGNRTAYLESQNWISAYLFGDGAGAFLLRKEEGNPQEKGIIASYLAVDPNHPLMEYSTYREGLSPVYCIDAHAVKLGYRKFTRMALDGLREQHPFELEEVARFYFHQANGRLLDELVRELGIPVGRVAKHVDRYGNTSAAATPILFAEDRRAGVIEEGDLCLFCTIGAGTQYGAMLVRL